MYIMYVNKSVGDWVEGQRVVGSSPNADKTRKAIWCLKEVPGHLLSAAMVPLSNALKPANAYIRGAGNSFHPYGANTNPVTPERDI